MSGGLTFELILTVIAVATPGAAAAIVTWNKVQLLEYQVKELRLRVEHLNAKIEALESNFTRKLDRHQNGIHQLATWAQNPNHRPFSPRSFSDDGRPWPSDDPPTVGYIP